MQRQCWPQLRTPVADPASDDVGIRSGFAGHSKSGEGLMSTLRCEAEIKIPFYRPAIDVDGASDAVLACLSSGWISNGPRVRDFEKAFAAFVGVSEGVAVSSCTGALHLALESLGIGAGDEVVVPDLTFVATAQAVILAGARPVLVDCK